MNFTLITNHNYSLTEIENMLPWERDIYVTMLINQINENNDKLTQKALKG